MNRHIYKLLLLQKYFDINKYIIKIIPHNNIIYTNEPYDIVYKLLLIFNMNFTYIFDNPCDKYICVKRYHHNIYSDRFDIDIIPRKLCRIHISYVNQDFPYNKWYISLWFEDDYNTSWPLTHMIYDNIKINDIWLNNIISKYLIDEIDDIKYKLREYEKLLIDFS